jgi:hypothetical protein
VSRPVSRRAAQELPAAILVFIAGLVGCAPRAVVLKPNPNPPKVASNAGPPFRIVHRYVITGEFAAEHSDHTPGETFFTPSDAEIARVDTALLKLVLQEQRGEPDWPPHGEYFIRYFGFAKDGRRVVSIMAITAEVRDVFDGKDPPLEYIARFVAFDGGCAFFEAKFDLSSSKLGPAYCNGQA